MSGGAPDIGWIGTLILLPLCDVMLVIDAFKRRQAKISV